MPTTCRTTRSTGRTPRSTIEVRLSTPLDARDPDDRPARARARGAALHQSQDGSERQDHEQGGRRSIRHRVFEPRGSPCPHAGQSGRGRDREHETLCADRAHPRALSSRRPSAPSICATRPRRVTRCASPSWRPISPRPSSAPMTDPYRDVHFTPAQLRELHFAALLHDFGKVAVREDVLLKAKKLPPALWERIDARFDLIGRGPCSSSPVDRGPARALRHPERAKRVERSALKMMSMGRSPPDWRSSSAVVKSCAPRTNPRSSTRRLPPSCSTSPNALRAGRRHRRAPLTPEELHFLQIPKGTLDDARARRGRFARRRDASVLVRHPVDG